MLHSDAEFKFMNFSCSLNLESPVRCNAKSVNMGPKVALHDVRSSLLFFLFTFYSIWNRICATETSMKPLNEQVSVRMSTSIVESKQNDMNWSHRRQASTDRVRARSPMSSIANYEKTYPPQAQFHPNAKIMDNLKPRINQSVSARVAFPVLPQVHENKREKKCQQRSLSKFIKGK